MRRLVTTLAACRRAWSRHPRRGGAGSCCGGTPGQRGVGGPVHPDAQHRRCPRRRAGHRLEPGLARFPVRRVAMVCAAAMIGAAMQAPLSGLPLVIELTHSGFGLMVPMMAATGIATLVAFHVDGYSIYSARLPAYTEDSAPVAPPDSQTDHRH